MKNISKLSFLLLTLLYLNACSDDKVGTDSKDHDHSEETIQSWICSTLCEWYLWNTDVQAKTPNYDLNYKDFFDSLLSNNRNDGNSKNNRYSYISRQNASTRVNQNDEYSFGMSVMYGNIGIITGNEYIQGMHAIVSYVVEGSPAWEEGIRRGHFITAINGRQLSSSNYQELNQYILPAGVSGNIPTNVTLKAYKIQGTGELRNGTPVGVIIGDTLEFDLSPALVIDYPTHFDTIINVNGTNVGYLVYNMFERGDNYEFDNELKKVFKEFKNNGVKELVLDLRYNGGGYVSSCQLLSSMIVSQNKLGTIFQKMTYNESITKKYGESYGNINFLQINQMNQGVYGTESGTNLNLERLYVIAGQFSASASEAVINSLRGAGTEVYHIGEVTEGKNVGMTLYDAEYDGYKYEMYPVTFYSCNAKGEAKFEDGFTPNHPYSEFRYLNFPEFGDKEKDRLLAAALQHIETGHFPIYVRSDQDDKAGKILLSTFDFQRKGMIMDMK